MNYSQLQRLYPWIDTCMEMTIILARAFPPEEVLRRVGPSLWDFPPEAHDAVSAQILKCAEAIRKNREIERLEQMPGQAAEQLTLAPVQEGAATEDPGPPDDRPREPAMCPHCGSIEAWQGCCMWCRGELAG